MRSRHALGGAAAAWAALALAGAAAGARQGELRPLPELALEAVEEAVRAPLRERRAEVDRLMAARARGESVDPARLATALGSLGELYLVYDYAEAAEAALANAATLAPAQPRWPYLLGTLRQLERRWGEAEGAYRKALELDPADLPALARLAEALLQQERWDEADALFARLEDEAAFAAWGLWGRGRAALGAGRAAEAAERLERVLELQPQAGEARYQLALAYRDAGDRKRARELLAAGRDGAVRFPDPVAAEVRGGVRGVGALLLLGRMALDDGALEVAERRFREALALDASSPHAHRALAGVLQRRGDADGAVAEYQRAVELDPDNVGLRSFLADLLLARARSRWAGVAAEPGPPRLEQLAESARGQARADLERARDHLEQVLTQARDHVAGWVTLAEARAGLGDLAGAAEALAEAAALRSDDLEIALQRARLLADLERVEEAVAALDAVDSEEGEPPARFEAARLLERAGRADDAERRFAAIAQSGSDARLRALAFFHLANLSTARDELEEAITRYHNALAENPGLAEAHFNLATLYGRQGRYAEAAAHHGSARELDPGNPAARFGEAMALVLDGREAEARARLEEALERFPDGVGYAHLLARLLVAARDDAVRDGAVGLDLARRLLAAVPSGEHAETVAMGLAEVGRFDEAVAWQVRLLEQLETAEGAPPEALARARARLQAYREERPWRSPIDDDLSSPPR
ncbi:MAG TPA: tetratricopeptide repeat protein [Thermoanaerobaculia bacterium]|nr:tetratricopeptide repeat protein [Thermoanaerobaculia bacterium]